MERILNLFGLEKQGHHVELPCAVRFTDGDVRTSVLELQLPCGHSAYMAELEYHLKEQDEWVSIGLIRDFALDESIHVLQKAKECIDSFQTE